MSCDELQGRLVGYHFGTLDEVSRAEVEGHLARCSACVSAFIALKRDVELAESAPAPSAAVQARLRASAAALLEEGAPRAVTVAAWRWWERPLAVSLAVAAVFVAVFVVQAVATQPPRAPALVQLQPMSR